MSYRIIVCGIYRSGTSLITSLIRAWGAYAGKAEDLFEDEYGYLEHLGLQRLNDELLGGNSRVPISEKSLLEKAEDPETNFRARQILATMDEEVQSLGKHAWVWKDPRIPMAFPFWSRFWKDDIYVIPVRHPLETILSAAKMEGLEPEKAPLFAGFIYWQYCMLNILKYTQNSSRKIFISYDQLLQNPETECERLVDFLDLHCDSAMVHDAPQVEKLIAQVEAGQRDFIAANDLAAMEVTTPEQRALYNFLRIKTLYPHETYRPEDFALHPGWMEHLQMMDMIVSGLQEGRGS